MGENERPFKWKMGQNLLLQERESKQTSTLLQSNKKKEGTTNP